MTKNTRFFLLLLGLSIIGSIGFFSIYILRYKNDQPQDYIEEERKMNNTGQTLPSDVDADRRSKQAVGKPAPQNPSDTAEYHYKLGIEKTGQGDFDGAIDEFNRFISMAHFSQEKGYNGRGYAKYRLGLYHEAIADYSIALTVNPEFADAFFNRGYAKNKIRYYNEALEDYNRSIELAPDNYFAYLCRGLVKDSLKDTEGAINDFTRTVEIQPNYAKAFTIRGQMKQKLGDIEAAIADYSLSIELDDTDTEPFFYRGKAKLQKGDKTGCSDLLYAENMGANIEETVLKPCR